jgi:hypothetical protein
VESPAHTRSSTTTRLGSCRLLALELAQVAKACKQLAPRTGRSCRNAVTMASVMLDEIRLRAHAGPIGEGGL